MSSTSCCNATYKQLRETTCSKKFQAVDALFQDLLPVDKFAYFMTSNEAQMLTWVGTFVQSSFEKRENYMQP